MMRPSISATSVALISLMIPSLALACGNAMVKGRLGFSLSEQLWISAFGVVVALFINLLISAYVARRRPTLERSVALLRYYLGVALIGILEAAALTAVGVLSAELVFSTILALSPAWAASAVFAGFGVACVGILARVVNLHMGQCSDAQGVVFVISQIAFGLAAFAITDEAVVGVLATTFGTIMVGPLVLALQFHLVELLDDQEPSDDLDFR